MYSDYEKTQKCYADISKSLESDKSFKDTVVKETGDLYSKNKFIVVGEKLGSRTINDQGSLGYTLTGDKAKADAFFTGFAETALGKKFKECDDTFKFEDVVSDVIGDSADEGKTTAEIWVSRFGHNVTEFKIVGENDGTKATFVMNPVFNKNEAVEIPTDFVTFSELRSDLETLFSSPSPHY